MCATLAVPRFQQSSAQPVIDMLAGLQNLRELNEAAGSIQGLGFMRVVSPEWCDDELLPCCTNHASNTPTHTVLLVCHSGRTWRRSLAVRDWLIRNPQDWQQFLALKRIPHFTAGCDAWERYTTAKDQYFHALEQLIK